MTSPDDDAAELELAVVTRRLGIDMPEDLAGGVLRGYRSLRQMTALLRRAEPAAPASADSGIGVRSSGA